MRTKKKEGEKEEEEGLGVWVLMQVFGGENRPAT